MIIFIDRRHDPHADLVERECNRLGVEYYRMCTEEFPMQMDISVSMVDGILRAFVQQGKTIIDLNQARGFWFRRPGTPTPHPDTDSKFHEYIVSECMRTLAGTFRILRDKNWVNHPDDEEHATNKIMQLRLAKSLGMQIPKSLVSNRGQDILAFAEALKGPVLIKSFDQLAIDGGDGEKPADLGFYSSLVDVEELREGLPELQRSPLIFQQYIAKKREWRIITIRDQIFPIAIYSQDTVETQIDYRKNPESCRMEISRIPERLQKKILLMNKQLNLRMAHYDFVETPEGEFVFLEVNPGGQWGWAQERLGIPLAEELIRALVGES